MCNLVAFDASMPVVSSFYHDAGSHRGSQVWKAVVESWLVTKLSLYLALASSSPSVWSLYPWILCTVPVTISCHLAASLTPISLKFTAPLPDIGQQDVKPGLAERPREPRAAGTSSYHSLGPGEMVGVFSLDQQDFCQQGGNNIQFTTSLINGHSMDPRFDTTGCCDICKKDDLHWDEPVHGRTVPGILISYSSYIEVVSGLPVFHQTPNYQLI